MLKLDCPIKVINTEEDVDIFAKSVGDYVQKIHDNYNIGKKGMQYRGLYEYCVTHFNIKKRTIFKWRGVRIKGMFKHTDFLKYIQKKNVQTRKEVDPITGYEYCVYGIDGYVACICKHYLKDDADGLIEKHSVVIL